MGKERKGFLSSSFFIAPIEEWKEDDNWRECEWSEKKWRGKHQKKSDEVELVARTKEQDESSETSEEAREVREESGQEEEARAIHYSRRELF